MKPIDAIFDALGKLTYAEMIELACYLRDAWQDMDCDCDNGADWAALLEACRVGWPERNQ